MEHGGCCNCFICKIGKTLGLIEDCGDKCRKEAKKTKSKPAKKAVKVKAKTVKKAKKAKKK